MTKPVIMLAIGLGCIGLGVTSCNTMAGLGADLGLAGDDPTSSADARTDKSPAEASGSSMPVAPAFAPGQLATVVKPGTLRDRPSLDGNVVGYVNVGDTYYVFDQQRDWVHVGSDHPLAWVFDALITVPPPGGPLDSASAPPAP